MEKPTVDKMLSVIGVLDIVIGGLIELWLFTAGLFIVLFSFSTNNDLSVFVSLFFGLVLGALFIKGGIGIRRRLTRGRIYLNMVWAILVFSMVTYIFVELTRGLSSDGIGSEYFSVSSWLGGIVFCSIMAALGILHIRFLNSSKVKELFV